MVRADSGINNPQQLAEKQIYLRLLPRTAEIHAMFVNEDLPLDNRTLVNPHKAAADFDNPNVDSYIIYQTNEPFFIYAKGVQVKLIKSIDYGIDFYGFYFFSGTRMLEDNFSSEKI